MDRIFISNLQIDAIIGIYAHERTTPQRVVLDLEMSADIGRAARSENIDNALNYKELSDRLVAFVQDSEFQLIETLAEHIASIVREEFNVQWVRLTLHKPDALAGSTDVGVIIERGEYPDD